MTRYQIVFMFLFGFLHQIWAQIYNTEVKAVIQIEFKEDILLTVTGTAHNISETNRSLSYVMSVINSDAQGNNSKSDQNGRLVLQPGEKKQLSVTTLNIKENARTILLLLVYEDNKLIGKDRKVLKGHQDLGDVNSTLENDEAFEEDLNHKNADGIFSKAMVIEDTKTKPGNDFYNYFYSQYLSTGINGDKVVSVKEDFAFGSSTRVSVSVEDDVIAQFYLNPRNDILKQMAQQAVYRVNRYFLTLKKNNQQIKRY